MTLYEFNALSENDQMQCVWDKGVFLLSRLDESQKVNLYALSGFFVEISYSNDQITGCRSFSSQFPLTPYLHQIALPILFE